MRVLNVGGGTHRDLPAFYSGWRQDVLDIDPDVKPDIVCDALKMSELPAKQYDAIFCSHNLEHFYQHDVPTVLAGFIHVLKPAGFANIIVPNFDALLLQLAAGRDVNDVWYESPSGPIKFHDVIFGWGRAIQHGNIYYAHKCAFTRKALGEAVYRAGFKSCILRWDDFNLEALAFKKEPSKKLLGSLGCPSP